MNVNVKNSWYSLTRNYQFKQITKTRQKNNATIENGNLSLLCKLMGLQFQNPSFNILC